MSENNSSGQTVKVLVEFPNELVETVMKQEQCDERWALRELLFNPFYQDYYKSRNIIVGVIDE